jgi:uncharacterized protein
MNGFVARPQALSDDAVVASCERHGPRIGVRDVLMIGTAELLIDPAGALYWPEQSLLVVADLHLEKGSAYAARRVFLPPYDTAATLARLAVLVAIYHPRYILALGDSFHDSWANTRIQPADREALLRLQSGRDWIWIAGNHDPHISTDLGGKCLDEAEFGGIAFRHEPHAEIIGHEIAGHLHPVARVLGAGGTIRRRCFVSDGHRCIMPAFGAYAGGLNWRDPAFATLFGGDGAFAHVMGRERVYKVSAERCLPS